jgi:hypothetical protein
MYGQASDEKSTRFTGLPILRAYKILTPETVRIGPERRR